MKPRVPDWLNHLLARPVAVFGGGVSGRAAAGLVRILGGESVVYDVASDDRSLRRFGATDAARHGLVVVSPGFVPGHEWLRVAHAAGCQVMSEMDFGSLAWPGSIIAVTGTNGKTTLTEFLAHALRLAGRDARAMGNVGTPLSDAWRRPAGREAIAVCEVSSFQAEITRYLAPRATIWTNFAEDHLERHESLEAYFRAKYQLVERTSDRKVFYGATVRSFASMFGLDLPNAGRVVFDPATDADALAKTVFARVPQRENYLMARALWLDLGLDVELLIEAAHSFELGPHRLSRVREIRGVTFWNDSKATNFHATEAALASFDRPVLWIGGGRSKGGDLAGFTRRIAPRVRKAFLLGETGATLEQYLRGYAVPVILCDRLRDAVTRTLAAASSGDHILLSPGFASFDQFRSYDDRGRQFVAFVDELADSIPAPEVSIKSTPINHPATSGYRLP